MNQQSKINILVLFFSILVIQTSFAQPPIEGMIYKMELTDINTECINPIINVSYFNGNTKIKENVLDLNCPQNTSIHINATKNWPSFCLSSTCDYFFEVSLCGKHLHTFDVIGNDRKDYNANLEISDKILDSLNLNDDESIDCMIEVRLMRKCLNWREAESVTTYYARPLQIINSSDIQTSYYFTNNVINTFHEQSDRYLEGIKACCCSNSLQDKCNENTINIQFKNLRESYTQSRLSDTLTHTYIFSYDLNGFISTPKGAFLSGKKNMVGIHSDTITWVTLNNVGLNEKIYIVPQKKWEIKPNPGSCVAATYYIVWEEWERQKWKADCISGASKIETINKWDQPQIINGQIMMFQDEYQKEVGTCHKTAHVSQHTQVTLMSEYIESDCLGNFKLESIITDLDTATIQIWWTNTEGVIFKSKDLKNVPYGPYTLHLEDGCCNSYSESYILCPNMGSGQWYKTGNDFCREISCGFQCSFKECVTPDQIEDVFDTHEKKCVKEYYYNFQLLGTTSTDPNMETEYNEFWEECVTSYFCNGNLEYTEEYEPDEVEWSFNDFWEECHLTVNCRGEILEDVDEVDAEITWEWDDFWEECVSTSIFCDRSQIFETIRQDPDILENWRYSSGSGCYRYIYCEFGGVEFTQYLDPVFDDTGSQGNCQDGYLQYDILCDGDFVDYVCISEFDRKQIDTRAAKKSKDISIITSQEGLHILFKNNANSDYTVQVHDMVGRVSLSQDISMTSSNHLKVSHLSSGIYVVNIINKNNIIHSQKVFINN